MSVRNQCVIVHKFREPLFAASESGHQGALASRGGRNGAVVTRGSLRRGHSAGPRCEKGSVDWHSILLVPPTGDRWR